MNNCWINVFTSSLINEAHRGHLLNFLKSCSTSFEGKGSVDFFFVTRGTQEGQRNDPLLVMQSKDNSEHLAHATLHLMENGARQLGGWSRVLAGRGFGSTLAHLSCYSAQRYPWLYLPSAHTFPPSALALQCFIPPPLLCARRSNGLGDEECVRPSISFIPKLHFL